VRFWLSEPAEKRATLEAPFFGKANQKKGYD